MNTPLPDIQLTRNDGTPDSLAAHRGQVLLVVNTASACGLTPQYEGLESLQQAYGPRGFEVLGFPANDFGAQEPGSDPEIAQFCALNYNVSFPMFAKDTVVGEAKQPLYAALTQAMPEKQGDAAAFRGLLEGHGITPNPDPEVLWNFEKFLMDREGRVVARFSPNTTPDDPELVQAIERLLG